MSESNRPELKTVDAIAAIAEKMARVGGPAGLGAAIVAAILRVSAQVMRDTGAEAAEILAAIRQPRTLKSWDELGKLADAEILEETKRAKPPMKKE